MSPFAFYIGVDFLLSAEPQRLFGPRCLYGPCFYLDKYGKLIS